MTTRGGKKTKLGEARAGLKGLGEEKKKNKAGGEKNNKLVITF